MGFERSHDNVDDVTAEGTTAAGTDLGATGSEGTTTSTGTEPNAPAVVSTTEDTPKYTVRVGGVEEQVALDELLNGYQRQSDYTRKTQELSAERQQLQQVTALTKALEDNPEATLRALADGFGLNLFGAPAGEELDPVVSRLDRLDQRFQAQEAASRQSQSQAAATAQINADLELLHQQYGEFDNAQLVQFAVEQGIPNLRSAYGAFAFETQRQGELRTAAIAAEKERLAAAKRDASVVEGGSPRAAGSTAAAQTGRPTVREALLAALKTHGG